MGRLHAAVYIEIILQPYTKEVARCDSVVVDGPGGHQHRHDLDGGGRWEHEAEEGEGPGRHSLRVTTRGRDDVKEEAGTGGQQVSEEDNSGSGLRLVEEGGEAHGVGGEGHRDAT